MVLHKDIINWEKVEEMVKRREDASKNIPHCPGCGTNQVQLVSWQYKDLKYKCRHCKMTF
ncbi:hypothetical protein KNT81_gp214 [Proteus phage phiP4-3]|uniref:Thioredoxin n=1 Tax=Proteus phage phiP4-3 TaxID=2065203 RepID=A0A2I6PFS0_9CAUD|nr:hypothetical protein KNT81_gp214 [Proteus phage phiP4-3]AUM58557.1 hypothetical protein phiP43_199 [Proteus phage phiP4-3]AZV01203.1 hypothetical protein vBSdyM006_066 [Shigella phage vB_SdyM_006]